MKVREIMTSAVASVQATDPIGNAAQAMADNDVGALPVMNGQRLVGIVTDRDISARGVAVGIGPDEEVRLVMSANVMTCSPETEIEDALAIMSSEQIRRLPVCDNDERLIGIIALGDIANADPDKGEVGETLDDISDRSALHCQPPVGA